MSSKRRNRSNANIPQETLERARKQAAETANSGDADDTTPVEPAPRARVSSAPAARRSSAGQSIRKRKTDEKMSSEMVAQLLANPTKQVTEDELRAHYTYVASDLRSMALLAAGLMVALVVLAQVLPR